MASKLKSDIAKQWRDDNGCKLNGKPAKVIGWKNNFATIGTMDGQQSFEWAWPTVARIMANNREFKS